MKTASAITNQFLDFHLLNLAELVHHTPGRGPYMVTQDGCDPKDAAMRACTFVLTKRRTWLHFYLYLALPEVVRQACAHFDSVAEILSHAQSLPQAVIVETAASLQDLLLSEGFEPAEGDVEGQAILRELRIRHGAPPQEAAGQEPPPLP